MREWLEKIKPSPWLSKKLLLAAILIAVGVGSFFWGRRHASATAAASNEPVTATPGASTDGYRTRVVAYVNNQPVFREELGEYLIARFGAERLDFLVNRKIVEGECRKYNIIVTDMEVEARFQQDLRSFGGVAMTENDFVNSVLKRFNKTLYEWREDVIRPKIMMERLVHNSVKIEPKDVHEGFEARYGPKVECRMIVLDKGDQFVQQVCTDVRKSREAFLAKARTQFIPNLAGANEGRVPPIHKHFGDKKLEDAAFRLKVGDVSDPIQMLDQSWVILLCENHIPASKTASLDAEYQKITREMTELRVAQRIPEVFTELRKSANPQLLLKNEGAMVSVPMPRLQVAPGVTPGQLPPNTPLPPPGIAPPSLTPEKK